MANLIRKTCTKPYQNRPHLVKDMTKNILVCFFSVHSVFLVSVSAVVQPLFFAASCRCPIALLCYAKAGFRTRLSCSTGAVIDGLSKLFTRQLLITATRSTSIFLNLK